MEVQREQETIFQCQELILNNCIINVLINYDSYKIQQK